jgi:APA family basic amino acid/polyamine antiporter
MNMTSECKQRLGLKDTIFMAIGFTIGSGVITMTGLAIGMTGRSVVIAYAITCVMFLLAVIPSLIMGSVYPVGSAHYMYATKLIHPKMGGFYMYIYFLGRLTISVFGISFAQYLAQLFPGVNKTLVAVIVLTIFYIVNLFGINAAAKFQGIMVCVMLASLLIFIVGGVLRINFSAYFTQEGFFVNGFGGLWSASSLLVFAIGGAGVLLDFGTRVKNPETVIIKVIIGVTIGVSAVYALLSIVASGILPYGEVAYQPLTATAKAVFGSGSPLYVIFVVGGALLALTTTLNSSFVWYYSAMLTGCVEGWFPISLAKLNQHDVPYRLLTIFYLFGLIPSLLNVDITILSKMAVGLTQLMWMIPVLGVVNLPKKMPEQWNMSKFSKMPLWSLWILSIISLIIYGSQVVVLLKDNPFISNVLIIGYVLTITLGILLIKKYPYAGACGKGGDITENIVKNAD